MARTMQHSVSDTRDSKDATFIITAHPDEFRSKEILRTVRSVVMHDYLRKAARDPGTKDRRAIKKALLQRCSRTGNSTVAANESWENMDRNIERPLQYNQMVDSSDWLNVISPAIGPSFAQNEMAALATSLQELTLSEDAKSCNTRIAPFINRMRRKRLTVRMPFMMQQSYGRDEVCESGENNINMPLLKIISGAYFASRACNQQWIPLVLQTPEAYLSCLCIVAPYADVFMAGKDADRITLSQFKQTLAITSVVSRMIKDRLNKPEHLGDDQTILAVMQLLNSQMAAPFGDTIQAHQDALGNLIRLRGGLSCLGGDGTIARMAVMVDYEISVVRNELVKPVYAAWMRSYLRNILPKACNTKGNPLLRIGLDNKNEYGIKDRSHEIVALLQAVHRLTDAANMVENEARKTDETRDVAAASLELREAVNLIHGFAPRCLQTHSTSESRIFESIRRASILFAHAVQHRRPLHKKVSCEMELADGSRCGHISSHMVFEVIRDSPIHSVWHDLAGALYWTLLVCAAALGQESRTCDDIPNHYAHESRASEKGLVEGYEHIEESTTCINHISDATRSIAASCGVDSSLVTDKHLVQEELPTLEQQNQAIFDLSNMTTQGYPDIRAQRSIQAAVEPFALLATFSSSNHSCWSANDLKEASSRILPTQTSKRGMTRDHSLRDNVLVHDSALREDMLHCPTAMEAPKRLYERMYLLTTLLRVSVLLRFEHADAVLKGLYNLERIVAWLRE